MWSLLFDVSLSHSEMLKNDIHVVLEYENCESLKHTRLENGIDKNDEKKKKPQPLDILYASHRTCPSLC